MALHAQVAAAGKLAPASNGGRPKAAAGTARAEKKMGLAERAAGWVDSTRNAALAWVAGTQANPNPNPNPSPNPNTNTNTNPNTKQAHTRVSRQASMRVCMPAGRRACRRGRTRVARRRAAERD